MLLPLVFKIIENSIYFQIENYLNKKKLSYLYQPRFGINHLTDFYPGQLTDFVLTSMDKNMHAGMILVDLQKEFNALDHGVLLDKMKYFDVRILQLNGLSLTL